MSPGIREACERIHQGTIRAISFPVNLSAPDTVNMWECRIKNIDYN